MPPTTLEGQSLGKFRVLEPLGRGGMAQVYRAFQPQLDRYVAIKVLRSDLVEEEEFLARFRREARAVATLRHTNIVQVYDFDAQDDLYYMVMELLEGDSLKAYLNSYRSRGERMPFDDMVRILCDVLSGLDYAHREGIVHRDIKPANILLTRTGQAVITDFGIAQIVGGTKYTVSGALMGTLHYMAPEQGLQGRGDNRSDLYSLGIVFYEMLTGQPPFDADTPLAILLKHVNDPLPLPHSLDPTIPESFERVILKSLAKQPEDRYQSAGEMLEALLAAAREANIEVPASISLASPEKPASNRVSPASLPAVGGETPAVYSGTARQNIPNTSFAADDTDASLGKSLQAAFASAASGANGEAAEKFAKALSKGLESVALAAADMPEHLLRAAREISTVDRSKPAQEPPAVEAVAGEAETEKPAETQAGPQAEPLVKPGRVAMAAITGGLLLVFANIGLVLLSSLFKSSFIFAYGWPVEVFLVGLLLSLLMSALANPWMLVPVGILVGNGALLFFYNITGSWGLWAFLWPLELIIVGGAIASAILLGKSGLPGRRSAARLGMLIASFCAAALPVVIASAVIKFIFFH